MSSIQGYKMKEYSMPTKRYCQTLSLKNNPILIEEYRKIHSEEKAWPEIRAGIRAGFWKWKFIYWDHNFL